MKEYKIPERIKKMNDKRLALEKLITIISKMVFGGTYFTRKYLLEYEMVNRHMWEAVLKMYPELVGKSCNYDALSGVVTVSEDLKGGK